MDPMSTYGKLGQFSYRKSQGSSDSDENHEGLGSNGKVLLFFARKRKRPQLNFKFNSF